MESMLVTEPNALVTTTNQSVNAAAVATALQ